MRTWSRTSKSFRRRLMRGAKQIDGCNIYESESLVIRTRG
jgi:hypothetical protein